MPQHGKRFREALKKVDRTKLYALDEAVGMVLDFDAQLGADAARYPLEVSNLVTTLGDEGVFDRVTQEGVLQIANRCSKNLPQHFDHYFTAAIETHESEKTQHGLVRHVPLKESAKRLVQERIGFRTEPVDILVDLEARLAEPGFARSPQVIVFRNAVYLLDAGTHLLAEIRFEIEENRPFATVRFADHRETKGVMLPHIIAARFSNDIEETTNPLEAGIGWTVRFDKPEFLGHEALRRVKAAGAPRKLVGLVLDADRIARPGAEVYVGECKAGVVTSGSMGLSIGKPVAMGYVDAASAASGTRVTLRARGQALPGVVAARPMWTRGTVRSPKPRRTT